VLFEENICEVRTTAESKACIMEADIFREYADLFVELGLLQGDAHLEVDPSVPPVQMPLYDAYR